MPPDISQPASTQTFPVTLEYCVVCGHLARALSLAEDILLAYAEYVSSLALIPSGGGVYEVRFGEHLLHSRMESGDFPHDPDIIAAIGRIVGAAPRWA